MMKSKYTTQITSETPAFILFLIDNSSSMEEKIMYEGTLMTKSLIMSRIMNITLSEIINYSKRYDGHKDYFNIVILGYSDDKVVNLVEKSIRVIDKKNYCTVTDFVSANVPLITYESVRKMSDGSKYISNIKVKEFVKCTPGGNTPMGKAIESACCYAGEWIGEMKNKNVFPPIVINITDGECTDCSEEELKRVCAKLKSLATSDGELLLFNIHIASSGDVKSALFPCNVNEIDCVGKYAEMMFDCSSVLPDRFASEVASMRGDNHASASYRAFAYNSSMNELLRMLNIGSISIVK